MDYKYILFDLDGTVTDPGIGITNSVMHALRKFGIIEEDRSRLYKFIGPPLADSFRQFYEFSEEETARGIEYYREYFTDKGIFENEVYEGMEELLAALNRQGRKLIIATSKPEVFAERILEHFHLDSYFSFVAGATMDEKRVKKAEVIAYALESCGISDLSGVLMIGDRKHDVIGAHEAGVDVMGVLHGYGSREELEKAGADYIVENVEEIKKFLS
ncbi:HAD family hydrolase [[Clostridium] hylemonae]|uniref:HAD hydrolase, family IA, variant 1 n=1 Tax=[Clostridium] hylemonae DSM 15053 TaxID=553973 RepID=C0BZ67_9FIRM|nr:HAD family hydrolase [[Clostridium] hylemonae]EEG74445.1 HAD hydrolase, family IA, variant 1 [[Clostridium] hylemonae DSM 15053]QEK18482.1 5'-nucleotidase [[Clostridium] hylemonae DSM 15053]